jgi:hypothetical protein
MPPPTPVLGDLGSASRITVRIATLKFARGSPEPGGRGSPIAPQ